VIDHPALIFLLFIAVGFVVSINRERRAHDRELMDKRVRHYQGGDLK
jgi:hypothetical protein